MKTESEVVDRLRFLAGKELDRRAQEASKRLPLLCKHNYQHPLDCRKYVEGNKNPDYNRIASIGTQSIGLCLLGSDSAEEWGGTICEEPRDAKICPYFSPIKGKEDVLFELKKDLQDLSWLENNLPEIWALLWVFDWLPVKIPWWKVLLFRIRGIRLEPMVAPIDPDRLLLIGKTPDQT